MAKEEQIKTSIDLTGEKEYRAACTNINSSLREIGSEMKLTTAEFADNADSVEALTAKQKLLQKQFDEQAKKAEAAEKALKKMRDNGIEPTNPAYQKMQTNLNNTKADMVKIQKEIDDTSKKLKSSKVDWESVGETVGKAGKAIGAACAAMGAAIAAAGAAFFGLAEETREARENMGKLETSFTTAGHSAEDAKNTYTELYGVLGDDGQATEAAAHLAKLTTNEKELSDWTNICTGVYATFGDSLPIEGLTEAANETAKTGSITGNLADALNWAGVSEDDFQASLDACTSEQERQALITSTLNGLYSEAADKYREVNGDIIDAQKATANLNSAMAALGAIAEPIITKLKQLAAELLQEITPFVELSLSCLNPFWREETETREDIATWIGGFEFPVPDGLELYDGWEIGYRQPSLIVNVYNSGDVKSGIRIEFRAIGAVTNPVLLNVDTREFIKLNISLVAGDVLTVSTGYGEKAVKLNRGGTITDAFRYLDVDSSYLQIAVGDNLFRYSADANAENLEVSIYHNNLYLGV